MRIALVGIAALILSAVLQATVEASRPPAPKRAKVCSKTWTGARPFFAKTSPVNQKIKPGAALAPGSSDMVQGLVASGSDHHFVLSVTRYAVPVYFAGPKTPRTTVRLTASWAPHRFLANVPIPSGAHPDPSSDGHLSIIDKATGCEYDFWQAAKGDDGDWVASSGNSTALSGTGIIRRGAARASGFALLAGLILPSEIRRGQIDHALAIALPLTRSGPPMPPATSSDGRTTGPQTIPMGARLQLDPSLDLSQLHLSDFERTIARALQVYGAFVVDTGGAVGMFAANPLAYKGNPYGGKLPLQPYVPLDDIPLDRFRVLAPSSG
jgi:hypothetical protein